MDRLIFVYNADGGFFNALTDAAHKVLSPSTYACNLCAITHSARGMRSEWRRFLDSLDVELEFRHRDERADIPLGENVPLPVILGRTGSELQVLIDAEQIQSASDVNELSTLVTSALRRADEG